jgi:hypothetical protein
MGWGDELMMAGEARCIHEAVGGKVKIVARPGGCMALSSVLWDNLDYIAKPGEDSLATLVDSPLARPYRACFNPEGSCWKPYKPRPAEISFTSRELQLAALVGSGFALIEPHVKVWRDGASNRDWGWDRYSALVSSRPHLRWVQVGKPDRATLPGVCRVPTNSFREACAVLARAAVYVGPEGGMHHAAAALGIPALVIFGGYIAPEVTGYSSHVNLFSGEGLGCGRRESCGCDCMSRILPDAVVQALDKVLAPGCVKA